MPGVIGPAAPATVLPGALSALYVEIRTCPTRISGPYADGRDQRAPEAASSRKGFRLTRRGTYQAWVALRDFYLARRGPAEPFYFYPRLVDYDPTGVSVTGRFVVRFAGGLSGTYERARSASSFELIEVE